MWGKTNTPVYASDWQTYNSLYGTTSNPWDLKRTPGGSSGGSAAAVAAGITALEIGADIGGSIRIPASFCGVFAHKPTYGLVSQRGLVPPPGVVADLDLAVVGPMARSARDLRLLLSIIGESQIPAQAPPAELKRLKVALSLDEPTFPLDADTKATLEAFASEREARHYKRVRREVRSLTRPGERRRRTDRRNLNRRVNEGRNPFRGPAINA